ncbi:MAG: hypothetical protein VW646_01355 [Hydrogenophilales bacterium]
MKNKSILLIGYGLIAKNMHLPAILKFFKKSEILNRWKKEVNRQKVILFQEMLDIFGITLYSYKDFLSTKE